MSDKFGIPAIPPPGETSRLYNVLIEQRAQLIRWINALASRIAAIPPGLTPPVLLSQLETIPGLSVLGRNVNSPGLVAPIVAAVDGTVFQRYGGIVGFFGLTGGVIQDGTIDLIKIVPQAAMTLLGRGDSGFGEPEVITLASMLQIVGTELQVLFPPLFIPNNFVTNAMLRDSLALSVMGRSVNSNGDPGDIQAILNSNAVLRESAGTVGWGLVGTNNLASGAVGNTQFRASFGLSIVGRSVNSVGAVADIIATAGGFGVLQESGSTLIWGLITNANLGAGAAIAKSKLENSAGLSLIGNAGTSAAPPADITTTIGSFHVLREASGGLVWGLLANANVSPTANIAKTKLESSAALSIVGRSVNSFGPLADIAVAAATNFVLMESGSALVWALIGASNIAAGAIGNAALRNSAALSVIGRAVNSIGPPADIVAAAGGNGVLTERGSALIWALLTDTNIAAAAGIVKSKLENSAGLSVLGRSGTVAGPPVDITTAGATGNVLRESGSTIGWGLLVNANIQAGAGINKTKIENSTALSLIGRALNSVGSPADIFATAGGNGVMRESGSQIGWGLLTNANLAAAAAIGRGQLADGLACSVVGRSVNTNGPLADIQATVDNTFLTRKAGVVAFTAPNVATTVYQKTFDSPTLWGQSTVTYPTLAQTNPTFFTPTDAERHFCGFIMSNGQINWLRFAFQVPADIATTNLTPRLVCVLNGAPGSTLLNLVVRGAYFNDNDVSSGGIAFFQGVNMSLTGYSAADYVIVDLPALGVGVVPGQYVQGVIERNAKANPNDTYADIIGIASIAFRGTRAVVL